MNKKQRKAINKLLLILTTQLESHRNWRVDNHTISTAGLGRYIPYTWKLSRTSKTQEEWTDNIRIKTDATTGHICLEIEERDQYGRIRDWVGIDNPAEFYEATKYNWLRK